MLINERHQHILNLLEKQKIVNNKKLTKSLYVSEATVRRDLRYLEQNGLLIRIRGGARIIESSSSESSSIIREQVLVNEKRAIAKECLQFIQDGDTCFFDSSTTVGQLLPLLKPFKNLTIITNGINNSLIAVANNYNVFLAGGQTKIMTNSNVGTLTQNFIKNFNGNSLFFSCAGITPKGFITEPNVEQAMAKREMLKKSKLHILLVDHTKFDQTFVATVSFISGVDIVITNKTP